MPSLRGALSSNQQNFLPPLMYRRITVTSAQWLALLGTPVTLIPAITNKIIIPEGIQYFVKQAGVAYVNAAVTDLRAGYTGSGGLWLQVAIALLTGFTDVTTQSIFIATNPRTTKFTSNAISTTVNAVGGLTLFTTGGDFTTGTGDIILWLSYRTYDLSNLAWF